MIVQLDLSCMVKYWTRKRVLSNATMDSGVLIATPDCVAIIVLTAASVYKARATASLRGLVIIANTRHAQMNVTTEVNAD
jgi:hypothetical protein